MTQQTPGANAVWDGLRIHDVKGRGMILRDHGQMEPEQLAQELLRQSDVLRRHSVHIATLEARVAASERHYNLPSDQIHAAIDAGTLEETAEVCNWIIDHDLLERSRLNAGRG